MSTKTIAQLLGDDDTVELTTYTVIHKTKKGTIRVEVFLSSDGIYGQRIVQMKDQPIACLKRKQISTQ